MMYWTCPYCGANLDPGEHCDCRDPPTEGATAADKTESRPGCCNIQDGQAVKKAHFTASSIPEMEEKDK